MQKKVNLFFTAILIPLDYLTLFIAAIAAYALRFSPWFISIRPITFNLPLHEYLQITIPLLLVWLLIFAISGLYTSKRQKLASEITKIILAVSTSIAVILGIAFLSRELFDSRFIVLAVWLISIILLILERVSIRIIQRVLHYKGIGITNIVIIGKTKSGKHLSNFFNKNKGHGFVVSAQYTSFNKETEKRILEQKSYNLVDAILVVDPNIDRHTIAKIKNLSDIEHLAFFYSASLVPGTVVQPIVHMFSGIPVVEVPKTPLEYWGAIYKRTFDIVASLILIILSLPIQIPTAIALLLERQGGIFFHQDRIGQNEKAFPYFKFRSMIKDAHAFRFDKNFLSANENMRDGTPMFKIKHDPRVTRIGKFIRAFSIDEIPEFYLVLLGHMSLVGPRPHLPEEVKKYRPEQRKVFTIKPGITGLSQVSGRASLSFNEEVDLDMHYIENWTPWLDLVIILKTPLVVLLQDGTGESKID